MTNIVLLAIVCHTNFQGQQKLEHLSNKSEVIREFYSLHTYARVGFMNGTNTVELYPSLKVSIEHITVYRTNQLRP